MVLITARQFPFAVEVSVIVTDPAARSAALGMYVALSVVLFGLNVPLPLVLHTPLPVLELPFNVIFGLFTHAESLTPALTTGALVIVIVI